jgi:hypothetical protein
MRGVSGEEYPIGRAIFEQTYTLDTTPPAQPAVPLTDDTRRLVACWNACAGLSTESLERSDMLSSMNQQRRQLEAQREPLLGALHAIDKRLRECAKHSISAAEAYDSYYQEIISAACQPLPADDTEGGAP